MERIEGIRTAEYLLRASPETVYEWFKARPQRTPESSIFSEIAIPEDIEQKLLTRNNEIVDLAIASWGTNSSTISTVYQRWCARSVVADWPPQSSTYPYAILAAILANVNAAWMLLPIEDSDWLIEHSDNDLFGLMHTNIGLGIGLLGRCAEKSGAYGRIEDDRWLFALQLLGYNKALHRIHKEYDDSPDLIHLNIHKSLVQAATVSPKTGDAAYVLAELFEELPSAATNKAYVSDEKLAAAVLAWDAEIPDDEKNNVYNKSDALRHSERIQFHLLKHYCHYVHLDPDDPVRVRRLAGYSKNPVNGGQGLGSPTQNRYTGKGLDIESFRRYSERDGPAFMYANSFNEYIWRNKVASKRFERWWEEQEENFPYPNDTNHILLNRQKCVGDAATKESLEPNDTDEESETIESKTISTIEKAREELGRAYSSLNAQVENLKKWLIWGGIIVIILLLLWR